MIGWTQSCFQQFLEAHGLKNYLALGFATWLNSLTGLWTFTSGYKIDEKGGCPRELHFAAIL